MRVEDIDASDRARKELGDLGPLLESLTDLGMLHPIVVTAEGRLVAGGRRLEAAAMLGWAEVPVTVHDLPTTAAQLRAERDENTCRLDMTTTEKVALFNRLRDLEAPAAKERQSIAGQTHGRGLIAPEESSEPIGGEARQIAADAAGVSFDTARKVNEITTAATDDTAPPEVREIATDLADRIDRPKGDPDRISVNAAHQQVAAARVNALIASDPAVAQHTYAKKVLSLALSHRRGLLALDPARVVDVLHGDEWDVIDQLAIDSTRWFAAVAAAKRTRLEVVQ